MAATRLARLLPTGLRHAATGLALRGLLRFAHPDGPRDGFPGVHVAGLLTSPTGLGEGARLQAAAFAGLGQKVGLRDLTAMMGAPGGVTLPAAMLSTDLGGPLVIHLNPGSLQLALLRLRRAAAKRKRIGYWAWELPDIPPHWRHAFGLLHEIWVPSGFVRDAVRRAGCPVPVRVVAHPVAVAALPSPAPRQDGALQVLTMFAYDSGFARKNPLGAIAAFRAAFGTSDAARLIVKSRGRSADGAAEQALHAAIGGAANITLIDQALAPAALQALLAGCDVLLSLHRAEGFGLPLAEAMLLGKPVVATNWSGNLEFMSEDNACLVGHGMIPVQDDSHAYRGVQGAWAEPSIEDAAFWLRRLADPALRARIGGAARAQATSRLGLAAFALAIGAPRAA